MTSHWNSVSGLSWHTKAWHLMGAAGALWACSNHDRSKEMVGELGLETEFNMSHALGAPYLTLCGLSLELLLKAIIVAKRGKPARSQNLGFLALSASVTLTEIQKGQLDLLSEYVTWAGRYPLSKNREAFHRLPKLRFEQLLRDNNVTGVSLVELRAGSQLDWPHFHKLWRHIDQIYWQHHHRVI
ncbi:MAG: hypothetical protein QM706_16735 [Nitrospira sp.]